MSRMGKIPIELPKGAAVTVDKNTLKVKGPKGELSLEFKPFVKIREDEGKY